MNRWIKYSLYILGALLVLIIVLVALFALTFNPNDYKPRIVTLVQEKTQRTLSLKGDIRLAFFPKLGIDLGKVSLSEQNSTEEFASVDRLRLYLALLPLFRKKVVVDEVRIDGLQARVVRHRDGTNNYDSLISGKGVLKEEQEPGAMPFSFNVEGIRISRSALTYRDEEKGRTFSIRQLEVKTGRLAVGVPTNIDIRLLVEGDQPKIHLDVLLKTGLIFNLQDNHFTLKGLEAGLEGEAAGITDLKLSVKGNLESTPTSIQAESLSLDVSGRQGDNRISGKITTSVTGKPEVKRFDLPRIQGNLKVTHPGMPKGGIEATLNGSAHLDLASEKAESNLTIRIDGSTITSKLAVSPFNAPRYTFDVAIDRLDADRYLPPGAQNQPARKSGEPEKPLDLSFLRSLRADGNLRVGDLKIYNIRASQIHMGMKAGGGSLIVSPISASLYQGTVSGALTVNVKDVPRISVGQNLKGIRIGPLMRDALNKDFLEGRGNLSLEIEGMGATVSAIRKSLNGSAKLDLRDGAIKGINIPGAIRKARAKLGLLKGEQVQTAEAVEQTDFSELKAVFTIKNGVAHDDLSAKSPLLRLTGTGDIDIGKEKLNYLMKATLVGSLEGQEGKDPAQLRGMTLPVRITGLFSNPQFKLDFNAMAGEAAKQKVEKSAEESKKKAQEKLKEGLKKLFR